MKNRYQVVSKATGVILTEFSTPEAREMWIRVNCEKRRGKLELIYSSEQVERKTKHA